MFNQSEFSALSGNIEAELTLPPVLNEVLKYGS